MADTKLSALAELAATPASDDEVYIRDVSEAAADESKRITVTNLMAAGKSIVTGTYTGNGGADRQITTGMKCSAVIVLATGDAYCAIILAAVATTYDGNDDGSYLHATDGFNVYAAQLNVNEAGYTYWAISE